MPELAIDVDKNVKIEHLEAMLGLIVEVPSDCVSAVEARIRSLPFFNCMARDEA